MNKKDIKKELLQWESQYNKIQELNSKIKELFYNTPESMFNSVIYSLFNEYTKVVSHKVGDVDEWLEWYCWENFMGKNKLSVKFQHWKHDKYIKNISDLTDLIIESSKTQKPE